MSLIGYKFYDTGRTRRIDDVLKQNDNESTAQFIKRCKNLGFEACDKRNVVDHYKFMSNELIRGDLEAHRHPNLFLMCVNIVNDFNIASCVRASNAFGVKKIILFGDKRFDQRGDVGTRHYENFSHVATLDELGDCLDDFDEIISLDNCEGSKSIHTHVWDYNKKTLIIAGQESVGVPGPILDISNHILYIKQRGSVRSINVAQAVAVALYDYNSKMAE